MTILTDLLEEKDLLGRLKNGDEKAFTQLYDRYWKTLFYKAAGKLDSLPEAEEVVQDIFLDIWNRRQTLSITGCLSAYLAVSLKYRVINALAKKSRHAQYQQYKQRTLNLQDSPTEAAFDFDALREQLAYETAKLPEKCQLVFRLSREEGYSHKEIAAKLQIAEKTVETHLTKALRQLKSGLSHLFTAGLFFSYLLFSFLLSSFIFFQVD